MRAKEFLNEIALNISAITQGGSIESDTAINPGERAGEANPSWCN
jgi:hypothetical protein